MQGTGDDGEKGSLETAHSDSGSAKEASKPASERASTPRSGSINPSRAEPEEAGGSDDGGVHIEPAAMEFVLRKLRLLPLAPEDAAAGPDGGPAVAGKRTAADLFRLDEHAGAVSDFLVTGETNRMFACVRAGRLQISSAMPAAWKQLLFFVRPRKNVPVDGNYEAVVQSGVIANQNVLWQMLNAMNNLYAPTALENSTWPASIRADIVGSLHKFLASLTEHAYETFSKTVLYIPKETIEDPTAAAKDKALVQRLESSVIHWTRQIKEVVNYLDVAEGGDDDGPLGEIRFWAGRSKDLSSIRDQLGNPLVDKMTEVLRVAKSSYLAPFQDLSSLIVEEAAAAEDNLQFLRSLEEPCQAMAQARVSEIPKMLPDILNAVRMIWSISRHYNTRERIVGLLRKVSNAIINRCVSQIDLSKIWEGNVLEVKSSLKDAIAAGRAWKDIFIEVEAVVNGSDRPWKFQQENRDFVFAYIETFVQRCWDLLQVCDAQLQFAPQTELPSFGGTNGPEIQKGIKDIQASFKQLMSDLHNVHKTKYSLLNVGMATQWHDDYNTFNNGVKDLEMMLSNVITLAFGSASSLIQKMDLLEIFHSMAKRAFIMGTIENELTSLCKCLLHEFVKCAPNKPGQNKGADPHMPKYAGQAIWALSLKKRIDKPMARFATLKPKIVSNPNHKLSKQLEEHIANVEEQHARTVQQIESYVEKHHQEWASTINEGLRKGLERHLIKREEGPGQGLLAVDFDEDILEMFQEVFYWERLQKDIPYDAMMINAGREKFRVLHENVLLVVRDYNRIIKALDDPARKKPADGRGRATRAASERRLFHDRLRYLDKRIWPGLERLMWISDKSGLDVFVREARKYCKEVWGAVEKWKTAKEHIKESCALVNNTLLLNIEKKRVYDHEEFFSSQMDHMNAVKAQFAAVTASMQETMASIHQTFVEDSQEVQDEWFYFTKEWDDELKVALHHTWKKSLQELRRALQGDSKTDVSPLFHVQVVLEDRHTNIKPRIQDLVNVTYGLRDELVCVAKVVPRLRQEREVDVAEEVTEDGEEAGPGRRQRRPRQQKTFFQQLAEANAEDKRTYQALKDLFGEIALQLHEFLQRWEDNYGQIWKQDKERTVERFAKQQKPLRNLVDQIESYRRNQEEVLQTESTENMVFLRFDLTVLKQAIAKHCEEWISNYTTLLHRMAREELQEIEEYFESNTAALASPPKTLDELSATVALHKRIAGDREKGTPAEKDAIFDKFEPLARKYEELKNQLVQVPEAELSALAALAERRGEFDAMLKAADDMIHRAKDSQRDALDSDVNKFVETLAQFDKDLEEQAPFTPEGFTLKDAEGTLDVAKAFAYIKEKSEEVEEMKRKSNSLKRGMDIFDIPEPPYKELDKAEKDLKMLNDMWSIIRQWQMAFDSWKDTVFAEINVDEMEEAAVRVSKSLIKIGREVKHWLVWGSIKETIDSFKKTMPLIINLRNPAMRERHWAQLMDHVGETFDPSSADFKLSSIMRLGLHHHSDFISELSTNASKELAIEQGIEKISETWAELSLDMEPYKATFRLRSSDDVFQALEDNVVTLSTMKGSKYFPVFEKEITHLEKTLGLVSEMIEKVGVVQKNWMYLENIFIGSEDIRKQLPNESIVFEEVHEAFQDAMREVEQDAICIRACTEERLNEFNKMEEKLEYIQKKLEHYLESKRQQFPRFYFLSDDDLLAILGQAKDPTNVQKHLKKLFEGIKSLKMSMPGEDGYKTHTVSQIVAPDGEILPLNETLKLEGRPEDWLNNVEDAMFAACKTQLYKVFESSKSAKKEKWVRDSQGQLIITAGQIIWTHECEKALSDPDNAKKNMRQLKKKWISYLNKLTGLTRSKLTKIERNKVVALITIEVHARDVIDKLYRAGAQSDKDFEWVSQLRFYMDHANHEAVVKQVLSIFTYGYEYQGNNGRLVITPLTDRCYMTLGAAMFTRRGGNPLGPAGTGKTETVKDFGKALARYVMVFNCSDGVTSVMTAKMFSGLAQTGAWACLDEFNRIPVEVLSVVATQIGVVMQAMKEKKKRFMFEGQEIRLISGCGIFVTMNPGYAGRSELPDNLKAILRPVSMMVPDFTLIAEIMMFSEGFSSAKSLAKKMVAIMELSQQQLSKQDHYDYGLRSFVIPIARAAGALKRGDPEAPEEVIMYRTMLDLIKPKLVYQDLPLFMALLSDLFPGVDLPQSDGGVLRRAIEDDLRANNLQVVPEFVTKIIQIFDCKLARHGNMIVGRTGSGKSTAWKCLQRAMAKLSKAHPEEEQYQRVHVSTINPLALSNNEIYGYFKGDSGEWQPGVLARLMRDACDDTSPDQKWLLFDGPVDTLWIESMNTTLDDNKLLTLLNNERIMMTPQVSLLFEVEDLSVASPATVSRAGMIYLNVEDLGWRPFVTSWLNKPEDQPVVPGRGAATQVVDLTDKPPAKPESLREALLKLMNKYIDPLIEARKHQMPTLVRVDTLNGVRTLCKLLDHFATLENGVDPSAAPDVLIKSLEIWFQFCLTWSLGADLNDEGRKAFDLFMREMDSRFPPADTVFEYLVSHKPGKDLEWVSWDTKLTGAWRPAPDTPFFKLMVPTIDTVRTSHIVHALVQDKQHTLVTGNVGVGKTMILMDVLESLPEDRKYMTINFSAQTSSNSLQDTIEGKMVKRSKGMLGPDGGKKMVCFIDDLNMPQKSEFGFIPPLELLKLWCDNGFWYDRNKCEVTQVMDTQLLAAMAPPGGGRNQFSQRVQACFSLINVTAPSDSQLKRIYSTLLNNKLSEFEDEVKPLGDQIAAASIAVYRAVAAELLPTPAKSHYLFNTRDLAKIVQGVMQASKHYYDSRESILQLWCHEAFRIIGDRMWDSGDKQWLQKQLDGNLKSVFGADFSTLFETGEINPFVSFVRNIENPPYEQVTDMGKLKELLTERMEDYGMEPGHSAMDLVLFRDALHHVCRIHRVLMQPRGNALLVGVGGSGRKSLARLATYIAEMRCFTIEITKNYRHSDFQEDLKELYRTAGVENKPVVFLFDETDIKYETFLEDVNNILTSGEVPNLFPKDELSAVVGDLRPLAKKAGIQETEEAVYAFFLDRVSTNLHVILCLSPVGDAFRERCRMFPGLVNCTTIDWFTEWPADALFEVAEKILEPVAIVEAGIRKQVADMFVTAHQSVSKVSAQMREEVKRINYITPTSYLETVNNYIELLKMKREQLLNKANKLRGGLEKLDETGEQVGEMQKVATAKKADVVKAKKDCDELLVQIVQDKRVADEQEKQVNADAKKIQKETAEADAIAQECKVALDEALPALEDAEKALSVLDKKDVSELKAYQNPPRLVELVLGGVLTVLRKPVSWDNAKKAMGDPSFLNLLKQYDKDKIDDSLLKKMSKFTSNPEFDPEPVAKQSGAAAGMCKWVHAMQKYGEIAKDVSPKRAKLAAAMASVNKKQAALKKAQAQLREVKEVVQALEDKYNQSESESKKLEAELAELEGKLERAEKLVTGLAGERTRWEATIKECEENAGKLPGDVVVAAAFMSYAGPFPSEYRDRLVSQTWLPQVKALRLPASARFDFSMFLADPSDVRDWNIQGLPADSFSTENGVLVTRGKRWPLMIDPQGQANKWIKKMEGDRGLLITDLQSVDMIRKIENGIQFGQPVLLEDVGEELDPTLEPILSKKLIKRGNQLLVKLGDKEVDYNVEFKLYITTKLPNPHYLPEISTKVTIVNFAVKEQGLQAQLLNLVVKEERPDLDEKKNETIVKVAKGKRTQAELEDEILDLLSNATGSLLDNIVLIQTLDSSKTTWEEVNDMLRKAEVTQKEIEEASQEYSPVALRASILYFVLNDLTRIDPMYQFSLDAYIDLFLLSIKKAPQSDVLGERIRSLNDFHTYSVYKYTTRGLFERHKLLLSLQMCVRILQNSGSTFNDEEFQFFLKGGVVLDRSEQPPNPAKAWITEPVWDGLTESDRLQAFSGIVSSFDTMMMEWESWYRSSEPESEPLPGEWESRLNELQKMVVVRSMRPDRVIYAVTNFVANALGRRYVDPPVLDLAETYKDSSPLTPLIFVLSPGVDPTENLRKLAKEVSMDEKFFSVALGQGQEKKATSLIREGIQRGHWVFLANCHLMTKWLPDLDKLIESFAGLRPHANFRLWLSSNPTQDFPISILQRSIKMTTEPPRGLRANLLRLYGTISEESFVECKTQHKYQKLLFALAFFHSVLLERRKFRTLGLNIPYDFNDTDFKVSDDILKSYLDSYEETPWEALKYLIAEANYGKEQPGGACLRPLLAPAAQ